MYSYKNLNIFFLVLYEQLEDCISWKELDC